MHLSGVMDPKNPRWMTTEERRARSARMWKIIVSALSGAALATMIVASCLDRDDEAKLDEPGVTQTTAAEAPAGGANDTSSGLAGGGGAAGVPADQPLGGGAPPDTNTGVANQGSNDTSTGAPMSRAPMTFERVDNLTINVSTNGAPGTAAQGAVPNGAAAPVAGHAAHQDNDPNALVQRGLSNSAAGVPTATSNDAGVPPVSNWTAAGPPIMMGIPPQGATTANPQTNGPLQGGQGITGGTPPTAPAVPTVTAIPPTTAPTAPAPTVTATPTVAPNTPGAPAAPPAPR